MVSLAAVPTPAVTSEAPGGSLFSFSPTFCRYLLEQFPAIGANSVLVPPIVWDKLSQLVGRPNALDRGSLSTKLVRVLRTPDAAKLLEAPHAFMLVYHRQVHLGRS